MIQKQAYVDEKWFDGLKSGRTLLYYLRASLAAAPMPQGFIIYLAHNTSLDLIKGHDGNKEVVLQVKMLERIEKRKTFLSHLFPYWVCRDLNYRLIEF